MTKIYTNANAEKYIPVQQKEVIYAPNAITKMLKNPYRKYMTIQKNWKNLENKEENTLKDLIKKRKTKMTNIILIIIAWFIIRKIITSKTINHNKHFKSGWKKAENQDKILKRMSDYIVKEQRKKEGKENLKKSKYSEGNYSNI